MIPYEKGQTLEIVKTAIHGDTKTNAVFPDRRPALKPGTKVTFIKEFQNFYGIWATVKVDGNDFEYDIPPETVKAAT